MKMLTIKIIAKITSIIFQINLEKYILKNGFNSKANKIQITIKIGLLLELYASNKNAKVPPKRIN